MGLDMNLYKKTYYLKFPEQNKLSIITDDPDLSKIKIERISNITEDIMYWRKANHIHGWFVKNCIEKIDNVEYIVYREDLEKLLDVCITVKDIMETSKRKTSSVCQGWNSNDGDVFENVELYDCPEVLELLPPMEGFFFGGQEIDDYYYECVNNTIKFLTQELIDTNGDSINISYLYHASW